MVALSHGWVGGLVEWMVNRALPWIDVSRTESGLGYQERIDGV